MALQIRKAVRKAAKLRLGISGPSGSGKTYGALKVAFGLGNKIGLIDTENGSGDLYAHLGDYDILSLKAPYTIEKYLSAIQAFEDAQYDVIIVDSLSHAWAGEGGLLDKQGKIADSGKGNSYTAWRTITPEHNALVEAMLSSPAHIIATMRAKQDYVQEKDDRGKTTIKKVGLAPIQREGMEYEFTIMFDVDAKHNAQATKDRTSLFDGSFIKLSEQTGQQLNNWLNSGEKLDEDRIQQMLDSLNDAETLEELQSRFVSHRDYIKAFEDKDALQRLIEAKDDCKKDFVCQGEER